ncbi:alpha/beta fold hydrolase [Corynebacterium lubricantis]|uniref:alpha/beta fold hydrolase n=1 Tax=Corynebacterium lubricantis TaxID=541095 RepID=UPI00035DA7DA|nr:alpha/beta hydrolase [Corynebacterium lubricantis]
MLSRITVGAGPTVILVHGVGDNAAGWSDLIASLRDDYRVVALDLRGHGHSPRFSESDLADPFPVLVADLIAVLAAEGPALVVGHSMGAAVAAEATNLRPELVRSLVLEDPAWFTRDEQTIKDIGEARALSKLRNLREMPKAVAERLAQGWSEVETHAWAMAHHQTQQEFLRTGVVTQSRNWTQVQADLQETGVPVLVLVGNGADSIVDKRDLVLPYREFVAGHCIRREQPEAYLQALTQHVDLCD